MLIGEALRYLSRGFSVIPVHSNKKPLIKWEEFQKRRATEGEVKSWFSQWPMTSIAIVTGEISGVVVIDIDDTSKNDIDKLIPEDLKIPTAQTPKGGLHLYFRVPSTSLPNNSRAVPGCDFRGEGGYVLAPPSPGYAWVPGLSIWEVDPPMLPQAYIDYIINSLSLGTSLSLIGDVPLSPSAAIIPGGQRNEALFHLANRLFRGGASPEEVKNSLMLFAKSCEPPIPAKELETIIQSASKRDSLMRTGSLAQEVRDWIGTTSGMFTVQDLYRELHIGTKRDKENIHKIIQRLQQSKIIEKYEKRYGVYRRIEQEYNEIDLSIEDNPLDIRWPFGIENLVRIMPKNLIVIAGEPNAGKTAFLLNVVEMNMAKHQMRYLSSEMGALELKSRLRSFDTPLDLWPKIFIERDNNFADLVLPDGITIVDFLEVSDEFYRIGGMMKEIYDRLLNGIAVIAIQKNPGTDYGLGGARGLEKPRLYLSMKSNELKIIKAKNWVTAANPNGLSIQFKLVGGAKFIAEGTWGKDWKEFK